jgi:hypothetical protein
MLNTQTDKRRISYYTTNLLLTKNHYRLTSFPKCYKRDSPAGNLRLLQAADMYSGQFSSLDMTAVDLGSEFQIVRAPDKISFDSPPVKAAPC